MRLNLLPPAIITQGHHPTRSTTRLFLVTLSRSAASHTLQHELCHVWQAWALVTIGAGLASLTGDPMALIAAPLPYILYEFIPALNYRKEAAAYAASVRHGRDIDNAAVILATHGSTVDEARQAIARRIKRKWLIL